MDHQPLSSRLPALAANPRILHLPDGHEGTLPPGDYELQEAYCPLPNCDCRRVTLSVVSAQDRQPRATVSFGWETLMYYAEWLRSTDPDRLRLVKGPTLVRSPGASSELPSPEAQAYLQLVSETALADPEYVAQLERHYRAFKADVRKSLAPGKKKASGKR